MSDRVLVCGGEEGCEDFEDCPLVLSQRCFTWEPEGNTWTEIDDLNEPRWSFLMAQVS